MKLSARKATLQPRRSETVLAGSRGGAISITSDSGETLRYQAQTVTSPQSAAVALLVGAFSVRSYTGPVRSIGIAPNRLPTSRKQAVNSEDTISRQSY